MGRNPKKLRTLTAAKCPLPIVTCPLSLVANKFVEACDGHSSFSQVNFHIVRRPFRPVAFSSNSTLLWQNRQDTDFCRFSWSFSQLTIVLPCSFSHGSTSTLALVSSVVELGILLVTNLALLVLTVSSSGCYGFSTSRSL